MPKNLYTFVVIVFGLLVDFYYYDAGAARAT
jgi:hypothetical protein